MHTFKKEERICENKVIKNLFEMGSSFYIYPFKIIYQNTDFDSKFPAKILVTITKRNFKNSVQRNKIKRLIKESYRINKNNFINSLIENKISKNIAFIYTAKNILPYEEFESKIILILHRLSNINDEEIAK